MKDYQAVAEHRASYPYSVELKVGETVTVTEKEEDGWVWCICNGERGAWVPTEYLARQGDKGIALFEYSSAELNAQVSERLSCSREVSGWVWCVNQKGERGWVPKAKLRRLEDACKKDV